MNLSGTFAKKALLLALTASLLILVLSSGALAQSVPPDYQYASAQGERSCPAGTASVQPGTLSVAENQVQASVGDGACAAVENVGQGTAAVNDALTGTAPSASASASGQTPAYPKDVASKGIEPASDEASASSGGNTNENETVRGETAGSGEAGPEGLASITELPETGGAPPLALLSGVLLVALGLAVRRTL